MYFARAGSSEEDSLPSASSHGLTSWEQPSCYVPLLVAPRQVISEPRLASLFIVAASSRMARGRVKRSVLDGRDSASLTRLSDDDASFVAEVSDDQDRVRLWGVRDSPRLRGTWGKLAEGDWVLFFARGFLFAAGRVARTHASSALGKTLWGDPAGAEFGLTIGFGSAVSLEVPASTYRSVLGARFLGFRQVNEEWRGAIVRRFGSVDEFIERELVEQSVFRR